VKIQQVLFVSGWDFIKVKNCD